MDHNVRPQVRVNTSQPFQKKRELPGDQGVRQLLACMCITPQSCTKMKDMNEAGTPADQSDFFAEPLETAREYAHCFDSDQQNSSVGRVTFYRADLWSSKTDRSAHNHVLSDH